MRVLDLFSGIGGFSLGLERAGMETVAFCEFDKHARLVLEKHWPNVPIHEDVRQLDGHQYRGTVDVICGGFPCQDISAAGNQAGLGEETRSGLWSECARLLGEVRPKYAIFENVTALISGDGGRWFQRVLWDISQVGYDAEWHCIPASELGAHHHRDRVWIICYPQEQQRNGGESIREFSPEMQSIRKFRGASLFSDLADTNSAQRKGRRFPVGTLAQYADTSGPSWREVKSDVGGTFDGLSRQLDGIGGLLSDEAKENGTETLRAMRGTIWQETYEWAAGGLRGISEAQILLSVLCEYERRKDAGRLEADSETDARGIMRSLWNNIESSRPSLQSRGDGQFAREYSDALCQLSHKTPSLIAQAWQCNIWEAGIPRVAYGVPRASHRLKQLGNAVVPQIPELIGRAILEAEHGMD